MEKTQPLNIPIPSGTLTAIDFGPSNATPILATHGWLDNAASFIPLSAYLAQHYRLISLDFAGHGLSQHRPSGAYFHFIDYAADIVAVMDCLKLERCILLGHSLGAAVNAIVAGAIPHRISELLLLDAIGPMTISAEKTPHLFRKAINQYSRLPAKKPPLYPTKEEVINARLKASPMAQSSVELLMERGLKPYQHGFTWRTDPRLLMKPLIMLTEPEVEAYLKNIQAPTCFIHSEDGWPFSTSLLKTRVQYISNIKIHELPGQHHFHMDNPEPVASILLDFLKTQQKK